MDSRVRGNDGWGGLREWGSGGLEIGLERVPVGGLLVGVGGAKELLFLQMRGHELETDGETVDDARLRPSARRTGVSAGSSRGRAWDGADDGVLELPTFLCIRQTP